MYRGRLGRDLTLWVEKGLLQQSQADAALAEYDSREGGFSAGGVLLMLAAVMLSAALLLLVAANWEAIPRMLRLAGMIFAIWVCHGGAALLLAKGADRFGHALLVAGTLSFGGAISLIGQMYHLSGDGLTVLIVWFALSCVSAVLFRSGAVVVVAGVLSWAFFGVFIDDYNGDWASAMGWMPPAMAVVTVILARYTGALRARHLAYLLALAWLVWIYTLYETPVAAIALSVAGMIAFLLATLPLSPLSAIAFRAGPAPAFYAYLLAMTGLTLVHFEYDGVLGRMGVAIAVIAAAAIGITLSGRDNCGVRYLAYAALSCEMLFLSFETLGTILDTSAFFLMAGVLVLAAALIVMRIEKRFTSSPAKVAS